MKLTQYEYYAESLEPVPGLLVHLYLNGDHSKYLDETYTDSNGRWYFAIKRAGTYDVCVQRLSERGVSSAKWIMGLRVAKPKRYRLPTPGRRTVQGRTRP